MKTVTAVMLVNGRESMVRRAAAAWAVQTYEEQCRALLILDTGAEPIKLWSEPHDLSKTAGVVHLHRPELAGRTIGWLRNEANRRTHAEVLVHFDSDDWSHPNRIAEQVALLEASGKEAVGYRDMLFWNTGKFGVDITDRLNIVRGDELGEAWLYTNRVPSYCLGTSLCYWREVWQRNPFADTSAGEDTLWLHNVKSQGEPSLKCDGEAGKRTLEPRMIASIHGANTYAKIEPRAEEWKRVPEWDEYCWGVMAL